MRFQKPNFIEKHGAFLLIPLIIGGACIFAIFGTAHRLNSYTQTPPLQAPNVPVSTLPQTTTGYTLNTLTVPATTATSYTVTGIYTSSGVSGGGGVAVGGGGTSYYMVTNPTAVTQTTTPVMWQTYGGGGGSGYSNVALGTNAISKNTTATSQQIQSSPQIPTKPVNL